MSLKGIVKSKKFAIIISYIMILANTLSNLLLTPLYLHFLGIEMYGLYQMVYSVAHYILILDFGISTAMVRYISIYHAKNDYKSEQNFSAHCVGIVSVIVILIAIIGLVVDSFLLKIYPSITASEAPVAHTIFAIMVVTISITIIEHFFQGIIMSYEHFSVVKFVSLIKVVLKVIITIIMLVLNCNVISIVASDLIVSILSVLTLSIYAFKVLHFKIKLSKFSKNLLFSILSFMFAIFLQAVVSYVNNVVDKTILGIMTTKRDVAVYSVALTFITLFNSLPSAISGVFLPQATKLITKEANRNELTEFVIRPGRYQFMICGAIIAGFILFGKEFITLWSGADTITAWDIALIIMIPNIIPLIENTVISILDAKKKRLFRSVVLFMISLVNVIVSVILVKKYGMMGAPIGTAIAFVLGYGIVLNVYYSRVIGIKVIFMFKNIFSRIWLCILIAFFISFPLNYIFKSYNTLTFLLKCVVFCAAYALMLFIYGFNNNEKKDVMAIAKKLIKK